MTNTAPRIARAPAGGCMAFGSFYEGGEFLPSMGSTGEAATRQPSARQIETAAKREERLAADTAQSNHIGTIGSRVEAIVTVGTVRVFDGLYGAFFVTIARDATGNVFVSSGARWAAKGETLRIVATVKAHEVREGVRQTILQRVKVKP